MSTDERQKYNFLVALLKQVRGARSEGASCGEEFDEVIRQCSGGERFDEQWASETDDRLGKCEQWLAALETALESLETLVCEGDGEDDDGADEGDIDDDVGSVQPPMGGVDGRHTGRAVDVGSPGGQQAVHGRTLTTTTKRVVGGTRGTR